MQAHWSHGISAALLGVLVLLPAPPASAQSRDDFSYWDASGNGDLTCTEAGPVSLTGGRDEGLRLPAYQDNRDGTGVIYEWLERSRSSDTDDDGIACDSASNPNGYIPTPHPDLVVASPSVSDSGPAPGAPFTLSATVRNDGDGAAAGTTLRYYRSTDATITTSDTAAGTDAVGGLGGGATSSESIDLTAPSTAGTYSYGACVDAVAGESDTTNNCSPSVQVTVPVETQACSADAETWRGLKVCDERPRNGYARDAFGTGYSSLEDEIIAALPPTMKANGQVYTPYSCLAFDITATGTAATDIEHIVALAETHDSGIADERRRDIASDLDNLTIADPTVNRSQKSDRDAAEWMPARHGAWFAEQVIQVKLEYGLSVDPAERDALEALLAGGEAQLNCVGTPPATTSPDLEVGSPTVSDSSPATGATFTLSATVSNSGDGESAATTLRYYRSTDATITTADTAAGTDAVGGLGASGSYLGSVDLTAPSAAGTYYYGACVDAVTDESDITNNCSTSVQVTVPEPEPVPALPLLGQLLLALGLTAAGARFVHRRQRVPPEA